MGSYRPFPPSLNPLPRPPMHPPGPPRGTQYSQNWGFGGGGGGDGPQNYNQMHPNSSFRNPSFGYGPPKTQHAPPPPQYSYPPPLPENSFPPPPQPPPPMYYPSSQYSQFNNNQPSQPPIPPPPPPPSSPPPSTSYPPPPPPPSQPPSPPPPPKNQTKESGSNSQHEKDAKSHEPRRPSQVVPAKQSKPPVPPVKKANGPPGRVETEEERKLRKKREFEKQKQEDKHRQQLKESQNTVLQKTQMLASGAKGHGSMVGSRMGERRTAPLLSGERIENRLKKPTTFLCKMKFRNELPDPTAQPKLMTLRRDKDRFTRYTITSLEKNYKPQLYVEPDLGIPLDLLDLSVYNPPSTRPPLAPEDKELLRGCESVTPIKHEGIKRKDRPTDKGVSWLVKTQYISPLTMDATKQSLTEKQAKELREKRGGNNVLDNLNNRERIQQIEATFEACKSDPVHATNNKLEPVEIFPFLPDFERCDDQYVIAAFDGAPTADSEAYGKLDESVRAIHESQAVMKSFVATGSDPSKPEKFLAYLTPSPGELSKDIYDENEDISFSWIREYHWDVRGDDADDPTTYLVSFDDGEARYLPLPTKLLLRKKRATEGRTSDEPEHFPAPSKLTVRRRSTVSVLELKDSGAYSSSNSKKRRALDMEDGLGRPEKVAREQDMNQFSGAEDDMSD